MALAQLRGGTPAPPSMLVAAGGVLAIVVALLEALDGFLSRLDGERAVGRP